MLTRFSFIRLNMNSVNIKPIEERVNKVPIHLKLVVGAVGKIIEKV